MYGCFGDAAWLRAVVFCCLASVDPVFSAPGRLSHEAKPNMSAFQSFSGPEVTANQARDTSIPLRILGLGASIMSGTGSTTGNGLRKPLRDALRQDGWEVDMVGSLHGGTMVDYEHEAVPGDVLTQVLARVPHSTGYKPNIVIINAGTNDANGAVDPSTAGDRMNNILDALWDADGMSDTCIMVSTLIPTTNTNGAANQGTINDQYRALVTQRATEGNCIYLAEMWPLGTSVQWFDFDTDYLATESPHVHPNDKGHAMMASVFYNAIQSAISDGRIVTPGEMNLGQAVCDKVAGTGVDAGGLTQRGSGYDDGIYYHDSQEMGVIWTALSTWDRGQWKFARLFSQNYDDLLAWVNTSDSSQVYAVWANSADGKGTFSQIDDMNGDLNCLYTEGVNFIDMNADGLDDLVYIDEDGNAYLSINQGDGDASAGRPPTFKRVSDTAKIMDAYGSFTRPFVVLADIDGDGRGDYGIMDYNGNVRFWRNGGVDDIPAYWQDLGQRYTGNDYETADGAGESTGTRFEDINGDGRDDMVWLDESAAGHLWTNARSCLKGVEGDGLNVAWREGFYTGTTSQAYVGMGAYLTDDETDLRGRVHFARIYGEVDIFGNLPKQDYVFMQHSTGSLATGPELHEFQMRVWKNTGGGGTKLLADGDRYCNIMGHSNGMVDYIWMYSFGTMEMWANRGKGTISDSDPDGYWDYQGTIWTPPNNINRKDLHLQDWDGDGDCDIIYADPDSGAVTVWINNYPTTSSWDSWEEKSYPSLSCDQHRGLGFSDLAVRFADISGNGFADYLCIEPDSTVHGYIHADDDSFSDFEQLKVSIGYDRANMRWADVNGDGLDDLLWIEKFSGDTYVWYNDGPQDPAVAAGSSFGWTKQDEVAYAGLVAGTCIYYADLDGNGFPDEHYILGTFNNEARTSLAPGCGLIDKTGDDADMTSDLPLPTVPSSGTSTGSSTGQGCVSGTGDGDYADLCTYTCARGYCPAPCTCTTTGTYDAGTADAIITGYAATGMDEATFGPLCDFACVHGYCPTGECISTVSESATLTDALPALPTLVYYDQADEDEGDVTDNAGDFFRYQFFEDPDVSLSVLYTGSATDLPDDVVCDDVTPGADGDFLGCVGDTVEWLMLSLAEDPNAITSRDTTSVPKHTFSPLPAWQGQVNCATHCQLQKRAPIRTWTAVGNGTYNGRPHSLYFMHTGETLVYKAIPGTLQTTDLDKRIAPFLVLAALVVLSAATNIALFTQISDPNKRPIISKHVAQVSMDAAVNKYLDTCIYVTVNDSSIVTAGTAPSGLGLIIDPNNSVALDAATDEYDSLSTTCEEEVQNKREYIVWPVDGNSVSGLRILLFSFDPVTDEHISVNAGYGTMYFRAFLTMAQATSVTGYKQTKEVEAKCTDNCPNPSTRYEPKQRLNLNETLGFLGNSIKPQPQGVSKVQERDSGWETQTNAVPELGFVSAPASGDTSVYIADGSGGEGVAMYILDGEWPDTSLSEFALVQDSNSLTIRDKLVSVPIGKDGWNPAAAIPPKSHGTAMLTMAVGGKYGIARKATPLAYIFDYTDTHAWVIDAVDKIASDWRTRMANQPVGVLSMSFAIPPSLFGGRAFEDYFSTQLRELESLGLFLLTGAGNDGQYQTPKGAPAIFANPSAGSTYLPNLLVMGSITTDGVVSTFSNDADWVTLYAPGESITVPYYVSSGVEGTFLDLGTSHSTAKTAGLAAYFLGLSSIASQVSTVAGLRAYLISSAQVWFRVPAIYNNAP